MSQVSPVTISAATPSGAAGVSVPGPEKNASQSATPSPRPTPATASPAKLRSCAVCRTRKVRCNKESPCSNCRRANIPCVFPSADRPPRWARRLERITSNAAQVANPEAEQVMERIRNLESLVKQLSGQLEQAHAAAHSPHDSSRVISSGSSPHDQRPDHQIDAPFPTVTSTENFQKQFGRLVLKDASRSRYISSGFWSRINDELDGLKMETRGLAGETSDTSEDESSQSAEKSLPTQELERTPSERHAFLFRHNLNPAGPDLREFQPLPSQVPFLLDVFSENVNLLYQIVHMPTVRSMAPSSRGRNSNTTTLTLANEALLFSIYYAAITSMEEDDIMMNFGSTKANLNLKYRLGLEHALAAADFLNAPELVLVQAFSIFLFLVRRHDSPRYVWMMTGLLIRMAQALGMHRDGSHFHHLTPFEVEMRRRVWWVVCILDVRASEDQGIDLTISSGSFDTRTPINLNDADISPDTKITPTECQGFTDMTFPMLSIEMCEITRRMMAGPPGFEEQSRLLNEMNDKSEHGYLQYSADSANICYWVGVICMRLLVAKMTLITHLPVLFSSPSEHFSDEIRDKLLVSAIEVAEHNHALNSEHACHHWRWVYQTFTHWHVIVYLLIEMTRRPWSSIVERAWVNLHSPWLIPVQSNRNLRIWVPLRKLMAKARKHRAAEVQRLRGDAGAARQLEIDDRKLPVPKSASSVRDGAYSWL
ncbi:fungal-specific transcription factor domain-containing protein [Pseudomassariella vexata]|uniref:Fungal-specific transcription factor domain-domain-containing protein n=1 Tax=Pseudomassariella vexata TaxID=1141098 RepID=A0A1Y2EBC2_9PEZI|nr:fungal-specific transcription factor domain-containing protein [Pseudomassariella vexata]ORY68879.1 fungal-specific transcription factor domain-domain-containing protein [Pseudomassariella vexata]